MKEKGAKFMAARERKRRRRRRDTCSHFLRSSRAPHGRDQGHTRRRDAPNRATHRTLLLPNALSPPRSSSAAPSPLPPSTGISPIALRPHRPASEQRQHVRSRLFLFYVVILFVFRSKFEIEMLISMCCLFD